MEKENIILRQLTVDFKQINYQFRLGLETPVIVLTDLSTVWGRWNPLYRTIELRRSLVFDYSWDTVLYVLKHEMAHQIVTEKFKLFDSDHKESFQRACDMLSLPEEFRRGSGDLQHTHSWKDQSSKKDNLISIVEKIQKLLALANATNPAEAAVAVAKAHELMSKYNIHQATVHKNQEDFKYILFDTQKERLNIIYSHLAAVLIQYYNVDVIFTKSFDVKNLKSTQVLEIYGRESNVLIAEYVLTYLVRTLDDLWKEHARQTGAQTRLKKSYQVGVIAGFKEKIVNSLSLSMEKKQDQGIVVSKGLLLKEKQERTEFIALRYPKLRYKTSSNGQIYNNEFEKGKVVGEHLEINKGLKNKKTKSLFFLSHSR